MVGAPQRGVCDGELGAEGGGRSILQGQSVFSDFVGITTKYSNMCASLKNAYIQKSSNRKVITLPRKLPWNLLYLIQTPIAK